MSITLLSHPPEKIAAALLVDLGLAAVPPTTPWPVYVGSEPETPDNVITTYKSENNTKGARHNDGLMFEDYGVQFRIRSNDYPSGDSKLASIARQLDQTKNYELKIDSTWYIVYSISRTVGVIHLGKLEGSNNDLFTLNCRMTVETN